MKTLFYTLLFITTSTNFAFAEGGSAGTRGGGDVLVDRFVETANFLLKQTLWTPREKRLLSDALKSARILSVDVLVDPKTGTPVPNQNELVAYGSSGFVQLKNSSKISTGDTSFEELIMDKKPFAQYVAHELFRASGATGRNGRSIDDTFQITVGQLHLENLQLPVFSQPSCSLESPCQYGNPLLDISPTLSDYLGTWQLTSYDVVNSQTQVRWFKTIRILSNGKCELGESSESCKWSYNDQNHSISFEFQDGTVLNNGTFGGVVAANQLTPNAIVWGASAVGSWVGSNDTRNDWIIELLSPL